MLAIAVAITPMALPAPHAALAQETTDVEETEISLAYASNVTVDTEGSRLRIYGEEAATYHVPVNINASCTVILDHVSNAADLVVADGVDVEILLRGVNVLNNIYAEGGSATHVCIRGDSADSGLTTNNIACAYGNRVATGAEILIENSTVICTNLACGGDGAGGQTPSAGNNASPRVTIQSAELTVNGNLACGGRGQQDANWGSDSLPGGTSGEVIIDSSRVTVSGNVAMGGIGGKGSVMYSAGAMYKAGNTRSASPVTIRNHSTVNVSGNVASQQDLPRESSEGSQAGLDGVTVTVSDSTLSAKDIARGGNGHLYIRYSVLSSTPKHYNIRGTAGGDGGTLIADHAEIICETAVCGGNAGEYQNYEVDQNGIKSGDYNCAQHPRDGNGGVIHSNNSSLTIKGVACQKGSRWNGYANASTYSDCTFLGGSLRGTVYGSIITTDMTSILEGSLIADTDIWNSEGASCAECVLQTDEDMAGQTVQICANDLSGTVTLDDTGAMHTYLGVGKQILKLSGVSLFTGTYWVKRDVSLNVFQLDGYGKIRVDHGGAVITEDAYTYQDETRPYNGDYTVTGHSETAVLTVEGGRHQLFLRDTSFDTLNVNGASEVILHPDGFVKINTVNVESGAVLTVASSGGIYADTDGLSIGECNGILKNEAGTRMYPMTILFNEPGTYDVKLNEEKRTVETDENGLAHFLLAEGDYHLCIDKEPFYFSGDFSVKDGLRVSQTNLTLYADISKGDLVIEDHTVTLGESQIQTDANISVIQSTGDANDVYIEKKDAVVTFENPPADLKIHLPEDFVGRLSNTSNATLQIVTIHTGHPDQELTLKLDGQEYVITTDSEGDFSFLAAAGKHFMEITIDGTTYWCVHPFYVSDAGTGSYSMEDDMTDDPDKVQDTDHGENTDHGTNTDGGKNPGTGAINTPGGGSSQTSHPSAGGSGQTPASSVSSTSSTSAGISTSTMKDSTTKDPTTTTPAAVSPVRVSPSITLKSSLKGISILSANAKNTYKLFTRKKIRFSVAREADTDYYYKILERGQQNSEGQWKKMRTDKITVSDNAGSAKGRRIVFKAVNETGSTVQKTTGFVIDTKRPTIDGVKNGRFYQKKCSIRVFDNCGSCDIRLNGKKMKQNFCIQKSGIYLLTASDPAGNQRKVLFAVLY